MRDAIILIFANKQDLPEGKRDKKNNKAITIKQPNLM
jgi:hypothetical protein